MCGFGVYLLQLFLTFLLCFGCGVIYAVVTKWLSKKGWV